MDKELEMQVGFYVQEIKNEILYRNGMKFKGNIEFKLNFVDGGLTGMNTVSSKSIRYCDKIK